MTWPPSSLKSGLCIQIAIHWVDWELTIIIFTCILPKLKCWFPLLPFCPGTFTNISKTYVTKKFGIFCGCFFSPPFLKVGIKISSPGLDKSHGCKHSGIILQLNCYPCKQEGSKSQESNCGFKQISCDISSTLRFVGKFKCCLCLSLSVCSRLTQMLENFEFC